MYAFLEFKLWERWREISVISILKIRIRIFWNLDHRWFFSIFRIYHFQILPGSSVGSSRSTCSVEPTSSPSEKIKLYIRASPSQDKKQPVVEIPLNSSSTIFDCVQKLHMLTNKSTKTDKLQKIWEPVYM